MLIAGPRQTIQYKNNVIYLYSAQSRFTLYIRAGDNCRVTAYTELYKALSPMVYGMGN